MSSCILSNFWSCSFNNIALDFIFQLGMAMVVVESAVTSIYICFAEDPLLIQRWDAEFFNQMSETLHKRLQHRSARAREILNHDRFDGRFAEAISVWRNPHMNTVAFMIFLPGLQICNFMVYSRIGRLRIGVKCRVFYAVQ